MKFFSILFIVFLFIKSFVYGIFELNDLEKKSSGTIIIIISIIAFLLTFLSIYIY